MFFSESPFLPATLLTSILTLSLLASPARCAEAPLERAAMGSCNRQSEPQPLWEPILAFQPQLWIWLGDNVYGDTTDMEELASKYSQQKNNPGYSKLLSSVPVVGLWDDHDYGDNDSGFNFPKKRESQKLFLDFFEEPTESPRRKRDGIYDARTFGPDGKKVLVVLLDVRFWRPPPNSGGDILGEAQWRWLEKTLRESDAQIHLLCSGTQFLPTEHRWEKWNDYPDSRRRLLKLLARLEPPGTVLLSGDRHFSEIMRAENPYGGPDLHELTSSGLTHFWKNFPNESNSLRLGEPFANLSFGTLEINWDARRIELAIRNAKGAKERSADLPF